MGNQFRIPVIVHRSLSFLSSLILHFQLAIQDKQFEELPVTHHCNTITATCLIPLLKPEERRDFLRGKATSCKPIPFSSDNICRHFEMFLSMNVYFHRRILYLSEERGPAL